MRKNRVIAWLLTFVMFFGIFGSEGLTAKAAVNMDFFDYTVTPTSLPNTGGTVTVTVNLMEDNADGEVYYRLQKQDVTGEYPMWEDIAGKENVAVHLTKKDCTFEVEIPENVSEEEVTYRFTLTDTSGLYVNKTTKKISVAASTGEIDSEPDKVLSDDTTFRAKVVDEANNPVEGVAIEVADVNGFGNGGTVTSDENGIVEYKLNLSSDMGLNFKAKVAERQDYESSDEHEFSTSGDETDLDIKIVTIDGRAIKEAGEIVFVVKKATEESLEHPMTSDMFRVKVVDGNNQPMSGVTLSAVGYDKDNEYGSFTVVSDENGIAECEAENLYNGPYTVTLDSSSPFSSSDELVVETEMQDEENWIFGITKVIFNGKELMVPCDVVFTVENLPATEEDKKAAMNEAAAMTEEMEALVKGDYTEKSWQALEAAVGAVKELAGQECTKGDLEAAIAKMKAAREGLINPLKSDKHTFRARVVDEKGNPLDGIAFKAKSNSTYMDDIDARAENGFLEIAFSDALYGVIFEVGLAEGNTEWKCEDIHELYFDFDDNFVGVLTTIDDKSLEDAGIIVYTLTSTKALVKPDVKVSGIKLSGISKKIAAGKKLTLTAAVSPSNAANKAVTWKSSNTKYATVTSAGKVTVKKAGAGKTVTITATAKDGSGVKATYKIKIMKNAVKSIKLKAAKSVKAGKSLKVKATVKTTGKKVNKTLKWTSSNTKYATVNSKGKVTAKKAGKGKTVKITAKSTDGTNKKKTVKIKIK